MTLCSGPMLPGSSNGAGGGGDFLDGDIFIRSVGAIETILNQPAHNLTMPPSIEVDDALIVMSINAATWPVPAGWLRALHYQPPGIAHSVFRRTATGDSNDNFLIPANNIEMVVQMVCIGNKRSTPPNHASNWQGGFLNLDGSTNDDWYVSYPNPPYSPGQSLSMSANTSNDPWAFVMLFMCGVGYSGGTGAGPSFSGTNPDGMEVIGEMSWYNNTLGADIFWFAWYFQYLPVSVSYNSYTATHLPNAPANASTQHTRWEVD